MQNEQSITISPKYHVLFIIQCGEERLPTTFAHIIPVN
jgi:hypothetical protein